MRFDHITANEGLSQSTVLSIAQDQRGFMWFATMDGLNTYDGHAFSIYRNNPRDSTTVAGLGIRRLFVDSGGRLWIVTFNGRVDRYDPELDVFVHYRLPSDDSAESHDTRVYAICEDNTRRVWIGIGKGWLYRLDPGPDLFVLQSRWPDDVPASGRPRLCCMHADRAGSLWIGTTAGLVRFSPADRQSTPVRLMPENAVASGEPQITALAEDGQGNLWIATADAGLFAREGRTGRIVSYTQDTPGRKGLASNRLVSLLVDSRANVWIGTADAGLDVLELPGGIIRHNRSVTGEPWSISGGEVLAGCEDRSGGLWFGTSSGGVNRLDPRRQQFVQIRNNPFDPGSLRSNDIWSVWMDHEGGLWVGTDGGGLSHKAPGQDVFAHYLQKSSASGSNSVTAVYEDRQGTVWIGTDAGVRSQGSVLTFDPPTRSCVPFAGVHIAVGGVASFCEDVRGGLWIGTLMDGVWRYDRARRTATHYTHHERESGSISGNSVIALHVDRRGTLWLGTQSRGVNRFDPASGSFRTLYSHPADTTSLSNNTVWCFGEDSEGGVWMGTWGGGVNRFDPATETFQRFTTDDGLPSNIVNAIQADRSGNIWLSTNCGICRLNTRTGACKNYNYSDGLPGNEFNNGASCAAPDGRLYFGGVNGILAFHPDSLSDNTHVPPIVLTGMRVFGKRIPFRAPGESGGHMTLSYRENFFTIEFAALDYAAPEKNRYTYMLEGVDNGWVQAGTSRSASYTDIAPGNYLFRVRGSNNDGVWSGKEATVALVITPPVWQTWWFRGLALAMLAGIAVAAHRYRLNKLLEVERTRVRIARDLHDEVSGTVTGIVYFSDAVTREIGPGTTPALRRLLSLINESATEVQEAMVDIIWSVTPENDCWEVVLPKFRRYASDLCESKGIRYQIEIPDSLDAKRTTMDRRRNLWLVYKEMVTNAVKHSGCSAMSIAMTVDHRGLHLRVEDNGKGFDPDLPTDRHGIRNIRARATALGGAAHLTSVPGKGTVWDLHVPL